MDQFTADPPDPPTTRSVISGDARAVPTDGAAESALLIGTVWAGHQPGCHTHDAESVGSPSGVAGPRISTSALRRVVRPPSLDDRIRTTWHR